jgi:hypothetical protein
MLLLIKTVKSRARTTVLGELRIAAEALHVKAIPVVTMYRGGGTWGNMETMNVTNRTRRQARTTPVTFLGFTQSIIDALILTS